MKQYNVLDLFCGCGGMSWGLSKKGYNIVAGIDIWDIALSTYQLNHKNAKAINLDITNADPNEVLKTIGIEAKDIDVIIGGHLVKVSQKTPLHLGAFWKTPGINYIRHTYDLLT